jgi:outer membrane biosynthesis protein TonB
VSPTTVAEATGFLLFPLVLELEFSLDPDELSDESPEFELSDELEESSDELAESPDELAESPDELAEPSDELPEPSDELPEPSDDPPESEPPEESAANTPERSEAPNPRDPIAPGV